MARIKEDFIRGIRVIRGFFLQMTLTRRHSGLHLYRRVCAHCVWLPLLVPWNRKDATLIPGTAAEQEAPL
jgi:hypothetical protein